MQPYVAFIEPAADGGYGIFFPDLPGCTSGADSYLEAVARAHEVLALHLAGHDPARDGPLPAARSFEAIRADPDWAASVAGAIPLPVAPAVPAGRQSRINISLDAALIAEIDAAAERLGVTRSRYLGLAHRALAAARAPEML